jgi:drug/metabolite transporter (DMT)-like permease
MKLKRVNGIVLTVLGIIFIVVAFVVLNGLGGVGAGHTKSDVSFALGVILLVVGAFIMVTRAW